jgi:hypothetical protein
MAALNAMSGDKYQLRVPSNLLAEGLQHVAEPLWKNTKAPSGRDVLYLLPHKITALEYGGISAKFFFNMTNRMKVTVHDLFSLPSMNNTAIKNMITTLIPAGDAHLFEQLVPLFQKITLQERKAGVLLQGGAIKGPITVQLATSLQLGERNFWLSKNDQVFIEELFKDVIVGDLDQKDLYKIRTGLGDTRLKIGLNTLNMSSFQHDVGFELILPTSKLTQSEKVSLGIAEVSFDGSPEQLKNQAMRSLMSVRDYLLEPRLGNGGHFGLGCYAEQKIGLFHDFIHLWIRASYDIFLQSEEERLFMFQTTLKPENLAASGSPASLLDLVDQTINNRVVTQFIREYVLPSSFKSTVKPGDVTNVVIAITADWSKKWRSAWGYDFYAQREEIIRSIHNTSVDLRDLRYEDAQSPSVYQHKFFSETLYQHKTQKSDLGIGFGSDVTVASRRIGADWTVYFKLAATF